MTRIRLFTWYVFYFYTSLAFASTGWHFTHADVSSLHYTKADHRLVYGKDRLQFLISDCLKKQAITQL